MQRIINGCGEAFLEMLTKGYAVLIGVISAVAGYFLPVKDTVHIIFVFFIFDVIFGYWAARKKDPKTRFKAKIIWQKTVPKMLVAFLLVITAHMLDFITPAGIITIRESVGWFVAGLVLSSVWQNMMIVTEWVSIKDLIKLLTDKIKLK